MKISRRFFLAQATSSVAVTCFSSTSRAQDRSKSPKEVPERILVLLHLSGGNDGLSTVIPLGDDNYHRSRKTTRFLNGGRALPLDHYLSWHPNLGNLRRLFDEGQLALVQGTGYPNPDRSHFRSADIWHAADQRGRRVGYGWIGRLVDTLFAGASDPNLVIHLGQDVPFSLHSASRPAVSFTNSQSYQWLGGESEQEVLERSAPLCEFGTEAPAERRSPANPMNAGRDHALENLRRILVESKASSEEVQRVSGAYKPSQVYPQNALSRSLITIASLIDGGLGTRIYSLAMTGFDTHSGQRPKHDHLMNQLDVSLSAFMHDLKAKGHDKRVSILAYSEFGRRLLENGSQGTDHGVAGPMFAIGPRVRGGIKSPHPSLTNLDSGDLIHTVDFRRVYASVIDQWFLGRHSEVLGGHYAPLDLFT